VTEVMEDLVVDGAQRCCAPTGNYFWRALDLAAASAYFFEALDAAGGVD